MKKLNNGVVPPALAFLIAPILNPKEGSEHYETDTVARGGDLRAGRFAPVRRLRC